MIKVMMTVSQIVSGALIAACAYFTLSSEAHVAAFVAVCAGFAWWREVRNHAAEEHEARHGWPASERCWCSDTCLHGVHRRSLHRPESERWLP